MPALSTERLILRHWRPPDREPFARINADPTVMEYFPSLLTRSESDSLAERIEDGLSVENFGFWAAELRSTSKFIGFIGLNTPSFTAAFTPCVEIGWRLAAAHWGQGLATEGARAAAHYAFATLKIPELVAFTVPGNLRSRRVMEKLGMSHNPRHDFDHPHLPEGHSLRRHVLYRLLQ